MKNILILFGGCSSEYGVSLESASGVISHMDKEKFQPILVGITRSGDWYHFTGDVKKIGADTWCNPGDCTSAVISPNRNECALLVLHGDHIERVELDAAFPILHGKNGEDGTVQGLLQLAGLPVVGCGVLASALCMDKDRAHKMVSLAGVRVPNSFVLDPGFQEADALEQAETMGYPLFVKPVKAGSSYGITKVTAPGELVDAIQGAFCFDNQVVIEEAIDGFEVGCAVMGNGTLVTGEIDEIELADGFFDFTEKYNLITSQIHVPARISSEQSEELKEVAQRIYRALGCDGFARVDLFLTPSGEIVFNEVNTIPGFTPHSRFPSMMKAVGMNFQQVITHAIGLAVEQ